MTQNAEFYAATVEEAVDKAAAKLKVSTQELPYEVIDTGSTGFMGIGARDARISVRMPDIAENLEQQQTTAENLEEQAHHSAPEDVVEQQPSDQPRAPEEVLKDVRGFMDQAIDGMGLDARVDVYDAGEFIAVDVSTEQAGLFIGQKGETIDALQYLASVSVFKDRKFWKRLVIDSEGYRQRRIEAIQGIAHRMARRALREKRTIQLPPMNASERRVVHVYLKENERVSTLSEGTGENRRVTVSPA